MIKKLLLPLIQKYYLTIDTDIQNGDLVAFVSNPNMQYEVVGIYYSYVLKPFLFLRDQEGRIFSGPVTEYKRASIKPGVFYESH